MRHGCIVAVAAAVIAGLGQIPAANAACNPRNPTACTPDTKPVTAAPKQAAAAPKQAAAAPLQLGRFREAAPARRATSSRSKARRTARKPSAKRAAKRTTERAREAPIEQAAAPAAAVVPVTPGPLAPKPVPTTSIMVPSLALASVTEAGSAGFGATTEPWNGESAFASADEAAALPEGVTFARPDEINEIDLAADREPNAPEQASHPDRRSGVSLVTQAYATPIPEPAATPPTPPTPPAHEAETSWFSRLYGRAVDGMLAAVLAVRSVF